MASSFLTSWLPQSLAAPSSEGCKSADKADAEGGADSGAQQPAAAPPSQQGELSKGKELAVAVPERVAPADGQAAAGAGASAAAAAPEPPSPKAYTAAASPAGRRAAGEEEATRPKGRPAKQRVRHRKVREGVTVFKGHPSYSIAQNLKLGITYATGRAGARTTRQGPLQAKDLKAVYTQHFPREGSATTPAHSTSAFQFKAAAPRHLLDNS